MYLDHSGEEFLTLPLVTVVGVPHGTGQVLHIVRDLALARWTAPLVQLPHCLSPEGLRVSLGQLAERREVEILGVTRPSIEGMETDNQQNSCSPELGGVGGDGGLVQLAVRETGGTGV